MSHVRRFRILNGTKRWTYVMFFYGVFLWALGFRERAFTIYAHPIIMHRCWDPDTETEEGLDQAAAIYAMLYDGGNYRAHPSL